MVVDSTEIAKLADLIAKEVEAAVMAKLSPGRWLTLQEAMAYAKVKSTTTIRRWIDKGYIYAHKRSGQWIVDRESIDQWYGSAR